MAALTTYNCTALTGGATRALDALSVDDLSAGDRAIAMISGDKALLFEYDATATDSENTTVHPYKVRPDDYATAGVWIEQEGVSWEMLAGVNTEALAAAKTLAVTDDPVQFLDPGGSDRDVNLPAEADAEKMLFFIINTADAAGEDLTIKNDGGDTIDVLLPGEAGLYSCDGTNWKSGKMTPANGPVYIDAINGYVGINTAAPTKELDVHGDINLEGAGMFYVGGASSYLCNAGLFFYKGAGATIRNSAGDLSVDTHASYDLILQDAAGNVGVNTNSPTAKMDVNGVMVCRLYSWAEDFDEEASGVQLGAGLRADEWTQGGTNHGAANIVYAAGAGGTLAMTTTGGDDDSEFVLGIGNWRVDENPILEARVKVDNIATCYFGIGFAEGSFVDKAAPDDDIILVGIDSDNGHGHGANHLVIFSNDDNGGLIVDDTDVVAVNDTYVKIKIDCTDTEQPRVWINDTEVAAVDITGTILAGTTLSVYVMVQQLAGATTRTLTVDYIKAWQDRE